MVIGWCWIIWKAGYQGLDSATPKSLHEWLSSMRSLATLPHVVCKLSGLVTETDWKSGKGISPTDKQDHVDLF